MEPFLKSEIALSGWLVAALIAIFHLFRVGYKKFQNRKTAQRIRLYSQLEPLWNRNHQIFIEYGPHDNNDAFYDLEGSATEEWRKKVKEIMLPNHQKIRDICSNNKHLMTDDELELFHKYEDHVVDFKSCHESNHLPNRTFPADIIKIFKD